MILGYGEKQCSSAFWNGELETELRDLGRLDFFALMKLNADREKVMQEIKSVRENLCIAIHQMTVLLSARSEVRQAVPCIIWYIKFFSLLLCLNST